MRTDIVLVNLRHQRVLETRESFIKLEPDRLEFMLDFDSEVAVDPDDEALGYKQDTTYYHVVVPKSKVVTIEMSNLQNPKRYVVAAIVGGGDDIKIYFRPGDKEKAEMLRRELVSWLMDEEITLPDISTL